MTSDGLAVAPPGGTLGYRLSRPGRARSARQPPELPSKPATRSSGRSGTAAWPWSTVPAISATTAPSRSRCCSPSFSANARRRAVPAGDPAHRPAAASPPAAAVRLRRRRRPPVLCHALHRRRLASRPARAGGPPPAGAGAPPRARGGGRPRLRAPPGRDPPRHQAREHPARGRPRDRGRLRRGPRGERGGRARAHRVRRPDRHTRVHEPRAGRRRMRRSTAGATSTRSAACCTRCSRGIRRSPRCSPIAQITRRLTEPAPTLRAAGVSAPAPLQDLLDRLLARQPAERIASAAELAVQLAELERGPARGTGTPAEPRRAGSPRWPCCHSST